MKKLSTSYIIKSLNNLYENPRCELNFASNFQLLVAVILSAQCTDKRVNEVTQKLFEKYKTPFDFKDLNPEELEKYIYSCGLFKTKAKNIILASKDICEKFNGEVPESFDDLKSLNGVGNKTANVVRAVGFNKQAFAVDTHVLRVSNRLNLVNTKNPDICEKHLRKVFNKKDWSRLHYQMVLFGRYKCKAKKPECSNCPFIEHCNYDMK